MFSKLPNEIIFNISKLVAQDSTLCLKPLVLVNRQWHAVVAPLLLATISVSSLSQVVELCSQIISSHRHGDNHVSSRIAKYTKTIVISGVKWEEGMADCYLGLEHPEDQRGRETEDEWSPSTVAAAEPDTNMPPKDISEIIQSAFPHLVLLDGFEWYGRFAGDYYLVKYLQRANVIRHLAYGVSSLNPAYYNNAFLFTGLKSVSVTCDSKPSLVLRDRIFQMMRRNSELQSILYDCQEQSTYVFENWRLETLICDPSSSSTDKSIAMWPNLQHLVLRFCQDSIWGSAQRVDHLAQFLIAHPKLETLFLYETCAPICLVGAHLLSLASHPIALPRLKTLVGSYRLIAGVLESRAACLSVQTVISTEKSAHDLRDDHETPYVDRIICALEKAPENQIHRLSLDKVTRLSYNLFAKLARFAPNVRLLELTPGEAWGMHWLTWPDDPFDAAIDIPAGLNMFLKLETIGQRIAKVFTDSSDGKHVRVSLLELGRQVPRLRSVHCGGGGGLLVMYVRGPNDELGIRACDKSLNSEDYDWLADAVLDCMRQPISYRTIQEARVSEIDSGSGSGSDSNADSDSGSDADSDSGSDADSDSEVAEFDRALDLVFYY